jgi:hypothetical protein
MLFRNNDGTIRRCTQRDVFNYIEANPYVTADELIVEFCMSRRWAYELIHRFKEKQDNKNSPDKALLIAYKEGRESGMVEGLVLGGLTVELLKTSGYAPSDLLNMIKQSVDNRFKASVGA